MDKEETIEVWVCPWDICNAEQAKQCRAEMRPRNGCGGKFPNMNSEQAKRSIQPRPGHAFADAENVAFIDAKNALIDAQRKVIEELVTASSKFLAALDGYVEANNFSSDLELMIVYGDAEKSLRMAIAKAKELTK